MSTQPYPPSAMERGWEGMDTLRLSRGMYNQEPEHCQGPLMRSSLFSSSSQTLLRAWKFTTKSVCIETNFSTVIFTT